MPMVTLRGVALKNLNDGTYKLRCHYQYNDEQWEIHEEIVSAEVANKLEAMDPHEVFHFISERLP
jgi:hypothetical protein